ncbi:bifunctional DNA primase/polymerase [Streptomyces sp. NBC_01387]|uniref:bifunctional DNA primase/polymerase n=1 Tax=unclassified Streptomyces TaxID=2593676 RepID=UPI002023D4E3|nr:MULTISPECIES: bifunctional DNA primase/polymerase [unclassified Streptomyces]MCX4550188.1 bifunctional DNA primase/polymerase [Streptomyces sp. NBC_01500]WSC21687.1 bifunctional DNA primase/polymerase [Streptomyces sp. NBC_01766]
MNDTTTGTEAAQIPGQRGETLLDTAVRYAEQRHWDVLSGTWLVAKEGVERCSCADTGCSAPGAHPTRPDWAAQATGSAVVARAQWSEQPTASVLLPTGRAFDAVDVPETAGFLALARMERMEVTLGPVTRTPDRRMQFFVLPGTGAKVPFLVRRLGWDPAAIDLTVRGEGGFLAAPPTRVGAGGAVQWVRRPTAANRWLPDADELTGPLAYACGQETRDRRA